MSKSVTFALLMLAQVSATAVDYGGSIANDTKFSTPASAKAMQFDDFALEQQDTAHLWARAPLSLSVPASIAAEGTLTLQYERPNLDCGDSDTQLIADLNLLTFECIIPDRALRLKAGRFFVADTAEVILFQTSDGILLSMDNHGAVIDLYGGYTGLLNAQNVTILNDERKSSHCTYSCNDKKSYDFAPPYLIGKIGVRFQNLPANQTLTAEGLAFVGSGGPNDGTEEYERVYGTLGIYGPLSASLSYSAAVTFASEDFDGASNLSQLSLSYFPNAYSMECSARALYASGRNGSLKPFKGFTSAEDIDQFFQFEYTSMIKPGLSFSVKPLDTLRVCADADLVYRCFSSKTRYEGFKWNVSIKYQMFSDLQLGLDAAQFLHNYGNSGSKAWLAIKAMLSF